VDFRVSVVLAVIATVISPATACAWGATGHEWVSGIAAEELPDEIPAFVRTPEAVADIAVLGRELDRSKGSGVTCLPGQFAGRPLVSSRNEWPLP
jgi:hypothetical protein